jgi:integrase/recombinase XerD
MLDHFPVNCDSDILAKAVLETAYSSALRSGEIRRLKLGDISSASGTLFLEQSKGRKDRVVPVGRTALYWIKRYIKEVRPRHLADPDDTYVFIGMRTGKPFRHQALAEFIKARLRKHGLPHLNIHQLRASAATHMVNAGMKIGYAQHLLGHEELNTTKVYVQIRRKGLDHILAKHHPRAAMEAHIAGKEA